MKKKQTNWKNIFTQGAYILFAAILGLVGGFLIAPFIGNIGFWDIIYTILILVISFPLHVILHELGHIVGGLLSGYEFIMFRLFDTIWIKTDEGLSKRKEYIPGIMGQALMIPPATDDGENPPFFLYHVSGILVNFLTALLFIILAQLVQIDWIVHFFYASSLVALFLAIMNALPFKGTDGYNISQLFKRQEASSELNNLLYMYRDMVRGESLESLQKYVNLDEYDSFKNPNTASVYSLQANYMYDIGDFEGARQLYQTLYDHLDQLFEGHRSPVMLNYLFTLLLTEPDDSEISKIIQSKIYKNSTKVKQSDNYRYRAAVAMYHEDDLEKAENLLAEGKQYIHLAPTVTDENLERDLYDYLQEELDQLKKQK